jgi:hypothetical protein
MQTMSINISIKSFKLAFFFTFLLMDWKTIDKLIDKILLLYVLLIDN